VGAQYAEQAVIGGAVRLSGVQSYRAPAWTKRLRVVLVLVDLSAIAAAACLTAALADEPVEVLGAATVPLPIVAAVFVLGWVVALGATRSRSLRLVGAGLEQYRRVLTGSVCFACGLGIAAVVLDLQVSPLCFAVALSSGLVSALVGRWLVRRVVVGRRIRGESLTPTLVVGPANQAAELIADLRRRPDAGYSACGVCLQADAPGATIPDQVRHHPAEQLAAAALSGLYGAVMVCDGLDGAAVRSLAWELENSPVEMILLPRLADVAGPRLQVSDVEGLALVHVDLPQFSGRKLWWKRGFDLIFSALALILLLPVFLLVALLIKLDDGGPVIFRQERIGRNGKPFVIHKFRTMCVDAEAQIDALIQSCGGEALLFKLEHDPRVTRLGAMLRRYSIDELPQFWSVIRGGMSVVGPRPQVSREVAEYTDRHYRRLLIKPGITGLWQVSGRSELSMEESIRLDLRYVENWSIMGDLTIIVKTVRVVVLPSGAF